jgi:hypothetical protein
MEQLKFGENELKVHVLGLFNHTVDKYQILQERETELIINMHRRKGLKSKCKNYRGITILPSA